MAKTKNMLTFILSILLTLQLVVFPDFVQASPDSLEQQIEQLLDQAANKDTSKGLHAGIVVYDVSQGKYLYKHNQDRTYIPASNLKLFTTVAALETLGPEFQFKTEIYVDGKVSPNGVLNGDLLLKGYGDPSLSPEDLKALADALKEKGITQINGQLLVDESYFDQVRLGREWMWDDELFGYSAQLSALALHENFVSVEIKADKPIGSTPTITIEPETGYLKIQNEIKIVDGSETDLQIERPPGSNTVRFTGTIGKEAETYTEDVTMEDPALFVADVWKRLLAASGITLLPKVQIKKIKISEGTPFLTHLSKPLSELIIHLNKESDNFYAEMLTKTMGVMQKGEGSFEAGTEVIAEVLKRDGITGKYRQVDGSGLSRLDMITADQMVQLLNYVQVKEYRPLVEQSLPIAGIDGTLKSRMKGTPAEKNLIAKTGSMSGVNGLSGYITAKNGDKLSFAILMNGVYKSKDARDLQDKLAVLLAEYSDVTFTEAALRAKENHNKLQSLIEPILRKAQQQGVTTAISVRSLQRQGEESVLYERDADNLLTPASNLVSTSIGALRQLDSDFRFKTEIYTSVPVETKGGVLKGDLIVKGYGDPTLHSDGYGRTDIGLSLESIAQAIKQKGIRQITGNLIVDDFYFDEKRQALGWPWDRESDPAFAQIDALSIDQGTVTIRYQPGERIGSPVRLSIFPESEGVELVNQAKTVPDSEPNTLHFQRERDKNLVVVTGNLSINSQAGTKQITIVQPALYTGAVLKQNLQAAGVKLSGNSKVMQGKVSTGYVKFAEFSSPPLQEIIGWVVKSGNSQAAEMIVKQIGVSGLQAGSTEEGIARIQALIGELGVDTNFDMVDGSGLTKYNQIAAKQIATLLSNISRQPQFSNFYNVLPIAGVDGTLSDRMKGTPAENNVRAIPGILPSVNSLSGYITTKKGEKLAFSVIMNGLIDEGLARLPDEIAAALADYQP